MYVRQQRHETVHHFWARFLLVKNKIKDCCDNDAVSVFHQNCTDEGIRNALDCHRIQSFTELSHIVRKYCSMESTWKAQKTQLEPAAFKQCTARAKRIHPYKASERDPIGKKNKPFGGHRNVLDELLDKPCSVHTTPSTDSTHSLRACWVLRQVAKSGEAILTTATPEKHSPENDDFNVLTVFETFSSNNQRKRALRDLAEVH